YCYSGSAADYFVHAVDNPGADRTVAVPADAAYAVAEQVQHGSAEHGAAEHEYAVAEQVQHGSAEHGAAEPEYAGAAGSAAARWEAARCCSVAAAWALLKAFSG